MKLYHLFERKIDIFSRFQNILLTCACIDISVLFIIWVTNTANDHVWLIKSLFEKIINCQYNTP